MSRELITETGISPLVSQLLDEDLTRRMVTWRRHLHKHPELSFEEQETSEFIRRIIQTIPGLEVERPTSTSVLGVLKGERGAGPCIALRADIDALPIEERTGLAFASHNPGVMHACGHDGHTAMLLAVAECLGKVADRLHGEVRFVFQHAEERLPGGARDLVEAGVMNDVEFATGCHLLTTLDVGDVGVPVGPCTAAADAFEIEVVGKGGHGAWPHLAVDPIAIGAQVIANLQYVVARQTDPGDRVVVSINQVNGGTANNVIPDSLTLAGTVRTFDPATREHTREAIAEIASGIAAAHGARAETKYSLGYDPTVNDRGSAEFIMRQAEEIPGARLVEMEPLPAGDDMAYLLQEAPGAYCFVGARGGPTSAFMHHDPRFSFDERALGIGAELLLRVALAALADDSWHRSAPQVS